MVFGTTARRLSRATSARFRLTYSRGFPRLSTLLAFPQSRPPNIVPRPIKKLILKTPLSSPPLRKRKAFVGSSRRRLDAPTNAFLFRKGGELNGGFKINFLIGLGTIFGGRLCGKASKVDNRGNPLE